MVGWIDELPADPDEKQHNADFENDNQAVYERRLFRAFNQKHCQDQQNEKGRHIHDAVSAARVVFEGRMCPLIGNRHVEPAQDAIGVLAPRIRNGRGGDRVFEDQIPTDDPSD